jgi:hypothetical protein
MCRLRVIANGEVPLELSDFLVVRLDSQMICFRARQDDFSARFVRSWDDACAEARLEEAEEIKPGPEEAIAFEITSITEVWVRGETAAPYISDFVIWDENGRARLHLRRESDEIFAAVVDDFPQSIHDRSKDPFFGLVATLRYR